jgi:hypothetical protein
MKKLLRLLALSPFYYATISLEALLEPYFTLRFPRNHQELLLDPQKLFEVLKSRGKSPGAGGGYFKASPLLPVDSEFESMESTFVPTHEPDKNRTSGGYRLFYRTDGKTVSLDFFMKFQCGRGLPLWLQAIRAAVEPNISREIKFYQELAGQVRLRSPQPYYADSIHPFNRVCLVIERITGSSLADWQGCPIQGVRAILQGVARMNAQFLGCTGMDKRTQWIPALKGLDGASFVGDFIGNEPSWYRDLWTALVNYFSQKPVTLIHGDCRPGNILFIDHHDLIAQISVGEEHQASSWPVDHILPEVVFTDWEAVNVGPLLSDFNYCIVLGLRVAERRAHQDRLLQEFLLSLQAEAVPPEFCDWEQCQVEVALLRLAMYFIDSATRRKGLWDQQGNTAQDAKAWSIRIDTAVLDVDREKAAAALNIATENILQLQSLAQEDLDRLEKLET